jgi:LuxR family transcriptional regulator, maltose regulon positive regulatory protein
MSKTGFSTSHTKVIIPALRPEVLPRRRLLAQFDDLLEKKLILINAPPGYGKTSLLVNFAHQSEMPVCWLSLDALDKDPQRFMTYLIAAMAERFPHFGKRSDATLRSMTSFEKDSEGLLSSLVNETSELIKEHFALVLDDYHFVDSVPVIRDLFSRFLFLVGENCHVILASRQLPTLADITLMVARQQVGGFDLEDLAFRTEEIRTLYEQNHGVKLASDIAEELVRQTEGWITGLLLLSPEATRTMTDPSMTATWAKQGRAARLTGVDLVGYLDQQVLSHQPPELRQFLLQTSLLEEFDLGLCQAVLDGVDLKHLFETVRRSNLFVLPVGPQGKWLRYHHLFQDFLQERILQESPETAAAIRTRLAQVYEERREWEKAYALTRQLNQTDALAGLVERIGTLMLSSERLVTLKSWLDEFPAAVFEKKPDLLSLKGTLVAALGDGSTALTLLDRAIALFQIGNATTGLPLALVRRAAARRLVGDYSGAVQDADEVLHLAANSPGLEMEVAEAKRFKGICLFRLGQVKDAVANLEESLKEYEFLGETESIARVQMDMGWICQATGKHADSAHFYQLALAEWKRENNLYSQSNVLNNLAVLYYMQGDYEAAARTLETGLVCSRQGGFRWQEAMQLASMGDVLSDLDEYESAHQTYTAATRLAQQVSYQFLVNYLFLAQARLRRLMGNLKEAHSFLQEIRPRIKSGGSNYELGLLSLESGCLALVEGKPGPAMAELQNALAQFQGGSLPAETNWTHAWLAAALIAAGNETAALDHLHTVKQALSHDPGDLPLVHMLRHAAPWLARLHPDPEIEPLLQRISQAGKNLPILRKRLRRLIGITSVQTCRLSIQVMGKPQVRMNGKLVTLSQWQATSVRDLFFFFLTRSHPVSKEEIGLAFWPDIDPDRLKLRFKNNLYRLRHTLGQDVILFDGDRYYFNRAVDYEYDVEEFDAHLAQVRMVELIEDKIVHLRLATRLWHGSYLQGVDADWAWAERHRFEKAYLVALRQLAQFHRQAGEAESALQACQRALEVDACLEDFHRLAMQLHAEQGNQLGVIWQYQACRDALKKVFDVLPSVETQALYQRLIA